MTGVDGRPELIIKGSMDMETWYEYDLNFKPGDVSRIPPIVMPH